MQSKFHGSFSDVETNFKVAGLPLEYISDKLNSLEKIICEWHLFTEHGLFQTKIQKCSPHFWEIHAINKKKKGREVVSNKLTDSEHTWF